MRPGRIIWLVIATGPRIVLAALGLIVLLLLMLGSLLAETLCGGADDDR